MGESIYRQSFEKHKITTEIFFFFFAYTTTNKSIFLIKFYMSMGELQYVINWLCYIKLSSDHLHNNDQIMAFIYLQQRLFNVVFVCNIVTELYKLICLSSTLYGCYRKCV